MVSFRSHLEVRAATLLFFLLVLTGWSADDSALLNRWIGSQTNFATWSADFTQTRTLKSLTQPLTASGRVWFAAPNRFHWELGSPAQTIAVRNADEMLVIYPKLKRVEKYPLSGNQMGQWKETLSLLEAGFPRDRGELDRRFTAGPMVCSNDVCEVPLQPKSAAARKLMPLIKIGFSTNDFALRSTELQFADGSTLRNDFRNPQMNVKIDPVLFSPSLDGFTVVEPLKR